MQNHVKIHVPSTRAYNIPLNANERARWNATTSRLFANVFGGYTETRAIGGYMGKGFNNNNSLIMEPVTIIESYCDKETLGKSLKIILSYARVLKLRLEQESIALTINGKMYFI